MNAGPSPKLVARVAGVLYLVTIAAGIWSNAALDRIVIPGDPSGTVQNTIATDALFRWSVLVSIVGGAAYVVITALLYELLAPVNRFVSLSAAFLSLVGCALWTLGGVFQFVALFFPHAPGDVALALRLHNESFVVTWLFFGPYCLLVGYLIFKSTYFPKALGLLLVLAGICDAFDGAAIIVSPPLADALSSFILLPALVGEAALAFWLLVAGIDVARYRAMADTAG
jgi:hypothetical protein